MMTDAHTLACRAAPCSPLPPPPSPVLACDAEPLPVLPCRSAADDRCTYTRPWHVPCPPRSPLPPRVLIYSPADSSPHLPFLLNPLFASHPSPLPWHVPSLTHLSPSGIDAASTPYAFPCHTCFRSPPLSLPRYWCCAEGARHLHERDSVRGNDAHRRVVRAFLRPKIIA
jgi:hypothetical protein